MQNYRIGLGDLPPEGKEFVLDDPAIWLEPLKEFHMDCRVRKPLRATISVTPVEDGWRAKWPCPAAAARKTPLPRWPRGLKTLKACRKSPNPKRPGVTPRRNRRRRASDWSGSAARCCWTWPPYAGKNLCWPCHPRPSAKRAARACAPAAGPTLMPDPAAARPKKATPAWQCCAGLSGAASRHPPDFCVTCCVLRAGLSRPFAQPAQAFRLYGKGDRHGRSAE